ncbi:tyrosine-type recombinase/integrase [Rhizobium tumorigenes]|uniref:tyrosine-type recombinase/integrase n=1 Tax=Rhizobium tumorigenes TaxID=2041385 RepID=UPI00241C3103|nr:integrase [Rhizobium tumorigenes]WFS02746.1 integrase [Rhizobium tumorigenes]
MALKLVKRSAGTNWYLQGSIRGIHVRESTKTDNDEAAEAIRILREQELLAESIYGKKLNVTFAQAAEAYLKKGGSTRFLNPLLEHFGSKKLRKIKQDDLDSAARSILPGVAPETLNRQIYTPFIAVWNRACKNDQAEVRLWERPRRPRGTKHRRPVTRSGSRPVDYERAAVFVAHMAPAPAMAMTALFYTGMRPIELFSLEPDDVDVAKRWIVVATSKTGEPRGVPMHEMLVPLFSALKTRKPDKYKPIFRSSRGTPYPLFDDHGGQMKSAIRCARDRLEATGQTIVDVSPYTARHTVSTQLVINGVHQHIKDQILGHAADDMSRNYTNVPQSPLIEAINTLPVPPAWLEMLWWDDPVVASRLQFGRGGANG